ncbi:hypothetical protein ACFPU0_04650 [Pseudomonas sp. GCM10022186]|uniref:hypothetical protein n=1 Tax=Pseudomonas sp. GCM10022186 TaxID=3252650 RepID=UPI00360E445D
MFFNRIGQKSSSEKAKDEAFMQAIKNIETLVVTDGRMSMDASELEDKVRASREEARKLVKSE